MVPGVTPAACRAASGTRPCVVVQGWTTRVRTSPRLGAIRSTRSRERKREGSSTSKVRTAPAPRGRYFCTSGKLGCPGRPA